jgi:hypothetical protein
MVGDHMGILGAVVLTFFFVPDLRLHFTMTWSKVYNNLSFASLQFRAGIYQVKKPGLCSLGQALTSKAYKKTLALQAYSLGQAFTSSYEVWTWLWKDRISFTVI